MLLFISIAINAQQKISDQSMQKKPPLPPGLYGKIFFYYDGEGNQIQRSICINCTAKHGVIDNVVAAEIIIEDTISYYPNPVKEELNLSWKLANSNVVVEVQVYGINGQLLKAFANLKSNNSQIISFQQYPVGVYLIVLNYGDGGQKTIKIIKK